MKIELAQGHIDGLKDWLKKRDGDKCEKCPFARTRYSLLHDCNICKEYFPKLEPVYLSPINMVCPCCSSNYSISEIIDTVKEVVMEYEKHNKKEV